MTDAVTRRVTDIGSHAAPDQTRPESLYLLVFWGCHFIHQNPHLVRECARGSAGGWVLMNEQKFTPEHAKHLTPLIESLRPDWQRPGIAAAICKARDKGSSMEVCIAAIKACVLTNRTPGVIPLDGPHWQETVHAPNGRPGIADKASHCSDCGLVHTSLSPCSPPAERSHGRGAAAARAALSDALGKPAADYAGPYTDPEDAK